MASGALTNIGGGDDAFHRYKMPKIVGKIEGNGNGIKTRIDNCQAVSKALHRDPGAVCKFFGYELGSQTTIDDEDATYIVNGAHNDRVLVQVLEKFINMFVLCENCKLPETDLKIDKKGLIKQKCAACGHSAPVDNTHKLCKYIINTAKQDKKSGKKDKKEKDKDKERKEKKAKGDEKRSEKKEKSGKKEKGSEEEEPEEVGMGDLDIDEDENSPPESRLKDDEWSADTSEEAVEARRKEAEAAARLLEGGNKPSVPAPVAELPKAVPDFIANGTHDNEEENEPDPVDLLKEFVKGEPAAAARKAKAEEIFPGDKLAQVEALLEALINFDVVETKAGVTSIVKEIVPVLKLMKVNGNKELEAAVCDFMDDLGESSGMAMSVPHFLKCFYDSDIVEEENIVAWYKRASDDAGGLAARKAAKPFIEWLENASEESE